jgi:hypothetical protein
MKKNKKRDEVDLEVNILVDYYAFNSPLSDTEKQEAGFTVPEVAGRHVARTLGDKRLSRAVIPLAETWKPARSFAPGARGYICEKDGRRVAYRENPDGLIMLDLPGKACNSLALAGVMPALLSATHRRASRVDIAVDIKTDVTPKEFLEYLDLSGGLSRTSIQSGTGETEYVGSQKSDRFLRVYRYAKPHPRADTLRLEFVYRRDYAKKVAGALAEGKLREVARAALDRVGCTYPALALDGIAAADITAPRKHAKSNAGTLLWLRRSCAPALARMIQEGEIDFETFHNWVAEEMSET